MSADETPSELELDTSQDIQHIKDRKARDLAQRTRALEDYLNLGMQRSVEKLFRHYVAKNREDPANRPFIPTLNRNKLYEWSNEDDWNLRAAEREAEHIEQTHSVFVAVTKQAREQLEAFALDAAETLHELSEKAAKEHVRLQAAEAILDRIGMPRYSRTVAAKEAEVESGEIPDLPDEDATPVDYIKLLKAKRETG